MTYLKIAIALTNTINYKISYLKGLMDHHFNRDTQNKIKMSSPLLLPILILVTYDNKSDNREREKRGKRDKQNQK